jgi:hypothetical protein
MERMTLKPTFKLVREVRCGAAQTREGSAGVQAIRGGVQATAAARSTWFGRRTHTRSSRAALHSLVAMPSTMPAPPTASSHVGTGFLAVATPYCHTCGACACACVSASAHTSKSVCVGSRPEGHHVSEQVCCKCAALVLPPTHLVDGRQGPDGVGDLVGAVRKGVGARRAHLQTSRRTHTHTWVARHARLSDAPHPAHNLDCSRLVAAATHAAATHACTLTLASRTGTRAHTQRRTHAQAHARHRRTRTCRYLKESSALESKRSDASWMSLMTLSSAMTCGSVGWLSHALSESSCGVSGAEAGGVVSSTLLSPTMHGCCQGAHKPGGIHTHTHTHIRAPGHPRSHTLWMS